MKITLYLALFFLATAFAQVVLKLVANSPGGQDYLLLLRDPLFYICCAGFAAQAYAWIAVLRVMPLSKAYPISSLNIVFTLICATFFFNETITLENIIGSVIIIGGIMMITGWRGTDRTTHRESQ